MEQHEKMNDLEKQRLEKLNLLYDKKINPYPNHFDRKDTISSILTQYFTNDTVAEGHTVLTAGRVMNKRMMGKAGFLTIADQNNKIQIYANQQNLNEEEYFIFLETDIGDIIGIEGEPFRTKTNEPSVRAKQFKILSKNLSPIPVVKEKDGEVFDLMADVETRYRKRYLDLAINPNVRQVFITRFEIIKALRSFLDKRGFIEVETPMMQSIASGAAARPFKTHHNTLNIPLFLRIAPELYLKRLIVGGFEKVFEINRNFRNEGISTKHNPEFTMMELYQAYANFEDMMTLTEDIFEYISMQILNTTEIPYGEHIISLKKPWKRIGYLESIQEKTGIDFSIFLNNEIEQVDLNVEEAKKICKNLKLDLKDVKTFWEVVDEVFSEYVEPTLIQPTFITNFPKIISPLAKTMQSNPNFAERFEPYIVGREMGNAFSELNDPIDQEKRLQDQLTLENQGAEETVPMDEDYIEALKVGMPPTGGLGLGIDRMIMLLTNQPSIKDVILFPLLRPKK